MQTMGESRAVGRANGGYEDGFSRQQPKPQPKRQQ
jgi:hypothetical protein